MSFGDMGKKSKERRDAEFTALGASISELDAKIEHRQGLVRLFDSEGYERFRDEFIAKIRLPQLYKAAALSLTQSTELRIHMGGQIAECQAMSLSKAEIENELSMLTMNRKGVQARLDAMRKVMDKEERRK
jgi:hypothetical protein